MCDSFLGEGEVGANSWVQVHVFSQADKPLPAFARIASRTPPVGLLCVHIF
jgi:hypothetical protein